MACRPLGGGHQAPDCSVRADPGGAVRAIRDDASRHVCAVSRRFGRRRAVGLARHDRAGEVGLQGGQGAVLGDIGEACGVVGHQRQHLDLGHVREGSQQPLAAQRCRQEHVHPACNLLSLDVGPRGHAVDHLADLVDCEQHLEGPDGPPVALGQGDLEPKGRRGWGLDSRGGAVRVERETSAQGARQQRQGHVSVPALPAAHPVDVEAGAVPPRVTGRR